MLGFTPFKKHANKFNYIPRYYDPEKEAREQRRAELRGERSDDAEKEYRPGQYIRTQRDARNARLEQEQAQTGVARIWKMALAVVAILAFIYLLFPRLVEVFSTATHKTVKQEVVEQEFDPYAPIIIVPNDYQEE